MLESHLISLFSIVPDPRLDRRKKHKLTDILVIAVCAAIYLRQNWIEVEDFGEGKYDSLNSFLELQNGIPSHDTFGRVFSLIDPIAF